MFPALMKKRHLKSKLGKLRIHYDRIMAQPELRNGIFLVTACLALISLWRYSHSPTSGAETPRSKGSVFCKGRYVYIMPAPRDFNEQLLAECHLHDRTDMCATLSNGGLGRTLVEPDVFTASGFYRTKEVALGVIFHNRLKQYDCLTTDAARASAIYVPYYADVDLQRTVFQGGMAIRNKNPNKLNEWLVARPEWAVHHGHDHFMAVGRVTWDFRQQSDGWGNNLLTLPALQNMTTLVLEGSPWETRDVAIPYPSFFHPSSAVELHAWQDKVRVFERKRLFSFVGRKKAEKPELIRTQLLAECRKSPACELITCDGGGACASPGPVMKLFAESQFCLQPQGDTATRKSIFDCLLMGSIPVFFHKDTYAGYAWHLPKNHSDFSVFIPKDSIRQGKVSVESVLRNIPADKVRQMRETIIDLIPKLAYSDPRSPYAEQSSDAFSIALKVSIPFLISPFFRVTVGG